MPELRASGRRKAAILLTSYSASRTADVLKALSDEELEALTLEIASLGRVGAPERDAVLIECRKTAAAQEFVTQGDFESARSLLEEALGTDKAVEILTRLQGSLQEIPFEFIKDADPNQICNFIQNEHPQTVALILAHLEAENSAMILSSLPEDIRAEVVIRIATMDRTAPDVVKEVERTLERKLASVFTEGFTFAGGIKEIAEVLNHVDRSTEKSIFSALEERDPELADEIKKLMFVFEDIVHVDDAGIQKALRDIDNRDLALALKMARDEVQDKVFKNLSERARGYIKEEMEFMGPVRVAQVEEAQQKIVAVLRRLEDADELIIMGRGGEEEIIV
jgi:flagellar motor switch protein FliG